MKALYVGAALIGFVLPASAEQPSDCLVVTDKVSFCGPLADLPEEANRESRLDDNRLEFKSLTYSDQGTILVSATWADDSSFGWTDDPMFQYDPQQEALDSHIKCTIGFV